MLSSFPVRPVMVLMVTVALTQLWCDFDKSSSLRNQTFNESSSVPDICFYPEVASVLQPRPSAPRPSSASAQTQRGVVQSSAGAASRCPVSNTELT